MLTRRRCHREFGYSSQKKPPNWEA
jgi:hypothetical protein